MNYELTIDKASVFAEVDRSAAYVGAKTPSQDAAASFERVSLTSSDAGLFSRFWREAAADCSDMFRRIIVAQAASDDSITLELAVSSGFDPNLWQFVKDDVFSYFVKSLSARWYAYTERDIAPEAAAEALSHLQAAHRKLVAKQKPKRPSLASLPGDPPDSSAHRLTTALRDLDIANLKISDLQTTLGQKTALADSLADEVKELSDENEGMRLQLTSLRETLGEVTFDRDKLNTALEGLRKAQVDDSVTISTLTAERDDARAELTSLRSQLGDAIARGDALQKADALSRSTIAEREASILDLTGRLEVKIAEVSGLADSITAKDAQITDLSESLRLTTLERNDFLGKYQLAQERCDFLEAQLEAHA